MKRIILMIALFIGASMAIADTSKAGFYNSQTGLLAIPFVRVRYATYNVVLKERIQGREYTFDLYSATLNPPYKEQGTATYYPSSGFLVVPEVSVDGSNHTYSVTLHQKSTNVDKHVFELDLETVTLNNAVGCNDSVYPYVIGCPGPAGGTVFYISQDGSSGMEAALADAGRAEWGCIEKDLPTRTNIGYGYANTRIINWLCGNSTAAYLAAKYKWPNGQTGGFLPSQDELRELYKHKEQVSGLVYGGEYWSSSQQGGQRKCAYTTTISTSIYPRTFINPPLQWFV